MAVSGRFGASFQKASDMEYDYICSPCEDDDLNAEAVFYCKQCCKQYCDTCEVHHRKLFRAHTVLNKAQVQSWGVVKKDDHLEMCEEHDGERIKMYCGDHNAICCHMCISIGHRSCKVVKPITEVAKGIHKKSEFKKLPQNISKTLSDLNEVKEAKENNSEALLDSRKDFLTTIQNLKTSVIQMFDDIEKRTIQELDKHLGDTDDTVQRDVQACTQLHDELKKLHDEIQDKGQKDEISGYIGFRKGVDKMTTAERRMKDMVKQDYAITFTENQDIKKYVSRITTFGHFETSPNIAVVESTGGSKKINRNVKTSDSRTGATSSDNIRVKSSQKYCVKVENDGNSCYIIGICQLSNGNVVLIDNTNKKAKLLDEHYTVTCHCDLPVKPWGLCHIQGDEVAVATSGYSVQFILARNGQLKLTRNMKFNHECGNVEYHNDQLYVSSGSALYIYTMSGQLVKKLYEDKTNSLTVNYFTFNRDISRIYLTNYYDNTLITLDNEGNKLATFQDPELRSPEGVCVADNNTVLVSGRKSHTILQVDCEGQHKLGTVATRYYGEKCPVSLWFNRNCGKLIVGKVKENNILVLNLA